MSRKQAFLDEVSNGGLNRPSLQLANQKDFDKRGGTDGRKEIEEYCLKGFAIRFGQSQIVIKSLSWFWTFK